MRRWGGTKSKKRAWRRSSRSRWTRWWSESLPHRYGLARFAAKFAVLCCDGFPTPFTSCLSLMSSSYSPCFTPSATRVISKEEAEPISQARVANPTSTSRCSAGPSTTPCTKSLEPKPEQHTAPCAGVVVVRCQFGTLPAKRVRLQPYDGSAGKTLGRLAKSVTPTVQDDEVRT